MSKQALQIAIAGVLAGTLGSAMIGVGPKAMAQTSLQRAQGGVTAEDLEAANQAQREAKAGQLATAIANGKARRLLTSGMASYSIRQDLLEPKSEMTARHRLAALGSVTLMDRAVVKGLNDDEANEVVSLSASVSGQFFTIGREIDGGLHGPIEMADVDLALSRGFVLPKMLGASSIADLVVGTTIPTSEEAQYGGIGAVPYTTASLALSFQGGRYNLNQSVSAVYVFNSYTHSPTKREINADALTDYSISTSARLGAGFRFTVGGAARVVHYLDDTATSRLSNFQILSWTRRATTVSLRHENGARSEDRDAVMWFVDEYRRIVSLSLSVRF